MRRVFVIAVTVVACGDTRRDGAALDGSDTTGSPARGSSGDGDDAMLEAESSSSGDDDGDASDGDSSGGSPPPDPCAGGRCDATDGDDGDDGDAAGIRLALGFFHTCALLPGDALSCWGANDEGQLGDGSLVGRDAPGPAVPVPGAVEIDAGEAFSCVRTRGGRVSCWGDNGSGQLGDGTTTDRAAPTEIEGLTGVAQLGLGYRHACVRTDDGRVACWGRNYAGMVGDGGTADVHVPTFVEGIDDAVGVDAGAAHSCALRASGAVLCWGRNDAGQLGDGGDEDSHVPQPVPGLDAVHVLAMSDFTTCVVRGDEDEVWCWGRNERGQTGLAPGSAVRSPTRVPAIEALGPFDLVRTGHHFFLVRLVTGELAAWGGDNMGQLGDGATAMARAPLVVGPEVARMDGGQLHTCFVDLEERLFCVGDGSFGQLGAGAVRSPALEPVEVDLGR